MSGCAARSEYDHPCRGRVRQRRFEVYTQPPGRGSFTVTADADMCDYHHKQFAEHGTYVHMEFVPRRGRA